MGAAITMSETATAGSKGSIESHDWRPDQHSSPISIVVILALKQRVELLVQRLNPCTFTEVFQPFVFELPAQARRLFLGRPCTRLRIAAGLRARICGECSSPLARFGHHHIGLVAGRAGTVGEQHMSLCIHALVYRRAGGSHSKSER